MGNYRIDPKKQFSKRLARWTAVFWFVYLAWLSVIMYLEPQASMYCFYMSIVVSVVMIVNVLAYTRNSIIEKLAFMALDKAKLEVNIGKKQKGNGDGDADESEVSNG
jgi:hypothetical protein